MARTNPIVKTAVTPTSTIAATRRSWEPFTWAASVMERILFVAPILLALVFKSKAGVKSVCTELAANLKAQCWSNDGPDLVTPNSSILKRKRGDAALTIFVKPDGGGSEVKMMTEGLTWEGQ